MTLPLSAGPPAAFLKLAYSQLAPLEKSGDTSTSLLVLLSTQQGGAPAPGAWGPSSVSQKVRGAQTRTPEPMEGQGRRSGFAFEPKGVGQPSERGRLTVEVSVPGSLHRRLPRHVSGVRALPLVLAWHSP